MSSLDSETALLHYRIINRIGKGGMGEVYRGWGYKARTPCRHKASARRGD